MKKSFMGVRLKRLREERQLTQVALARALGLSPSYLNQLEQNQRPLTVSVLLKLNGVFGVDVQRFAEDDEARLVTELQDVLAEAPGGEGVSQAEIRELASAMPALARAFLGLHRRYRQGAEQVAALSARLGGTGEGTVAAPAPFEEVRDLFYARHNHVAELDALAEQRWAEWGLTPGDTAPALADILARRHGVKVVLGGGRETGAATPETPGEALRRYDARQRLLTLAPHLNPGQRAFQLATQLAFLEGGEVIQRLAAEADLSGEEARRLARIGLANYFAGALLLPYAPFLAAAESLGYDIERLGRRFGVGFESVCHRLSTLQRPDARGVPFFFVRVDRAGNISKRQSATDFHFSRVGGSCPLWNVYEAFAQPGRILTQLAAMPDGRAYFWLARTVRRGYQGWGAPGKTFAVGLGCDLAYAHRLVYSHGLDLLDPAARTPIGAGCKVCERADCPQRAFPPLGRPLAVDEDRTGFVPYPVGS